ncbi:hypothetical protein H5410_001830 [Solanum commersonii]|uniref:Uncharacterized protein n=1 Tax=Solanum commersonii TaxID=4109 RepID=A0A9J6B092_SOLCO|nr:hypothetical protein H5410_001830 [Solanum commersonii]
MMIFGHSNQLDNFFIRWVDVVMDVEESEALSSDLLHDFNRYIFKTFLSSSTSHVLQSSASQPRQSSASLRFQNFIFFLPSSAFMTSAILCFTTLAVLCFMTSACTFSELFLLFFFILPSSDSRPQQQSRMQKFSSFRVVAMAMDFVYYQV